MISLTISIGAVPGGNARCLGAHLASSLAEPCDGGGPDAPL